MTVRVLYFAALRDLAGVHEEELVLTPSTQTLRDLLAVLTQRHPALAGRLDQVRVARNESFADLEDGLHEQDTIALIPPVAGG